ncbi:MAG: hypothetical protein K2O43_03305 [Muribaculaceae bacterium]|nr:hypothetical protein [Muribaculaceae bacterium]
MMKRNNVLKQLSVIIVVILAITSLTSCLSKEKVQLKKSVEEYASTLPQNVAPGVTIMSVSYDTDDNKVVLKCDIENEAVAEAAKVNSVMLKAAFVPYLKHAKAGNQFITNMINADATLDCQFLHADKQSASFEVTADEIK